MYFLCSLQHRASQFIWGTLKPHLPTITLYTPHIRGGLSMPNFTKYYGAAQLAQLPKYHATKENPLWVALESVDCDPLSTAYLLWLTPAQSRSINNPITKHSLTIWDRLKTSFGLQSHHNPLLSFVHNPSFYAAWSSPTSFSTWSNTGLIHAYHFFKSNTIRPSSTLCECSTFQPQKPSGNYKSNTS